MPHPQLPFRTQPPIPTPAELEAKRSSIFKLHSGVQHNVDTLERDLEAAKAKRAQTSAHIDFLGKRMENLTADLHKLNAEQQRDLEEARKLMREFEQRRAQAREAGRRSHGVGPGISQVQVVEVQKR